MQQEKLIETLNKIINPLVDRLAFDLVDVEFVKESAEWYLRVYIDKAGGITIDDCEKLSSILSDRLDDEDPIRRSYILEVSSPGLDRPLKTQADFDRYRGELLEVQMLSAGADLERIAISGAKNGNNTVIEGRLEKLEDGVLFLWVESKSKKTKEEEALKISMDKVVTVKRAIRFK
ncbi:MAG: ribosome maturation factor RimP [Oscillospiraceae bacterium]|nr:ribosome maturation factor RimP [Oscillospiraceae bacterium]